MRRAQAAAKLPGVAQGADRRRAGARSSAGRADSGTAGGAGAGLPTCWPPPPRWARTSCRGWPHCSTCSRSATLPMWSDADTLIRPIVRRQRHGHGAVVGRGVGDHGRAASFDPVATRAAALDRGGEPARLLGVALRSAELFRSERPELTAARVVISGGRGMQAATTLSFGTIADSLVPRWVLHAPRWMPVSCQRLPGGAAPGRSWPRSSISLSEYRPRSAASC